MSGYTLSAIFVSAILIVCLFFVFYYPYPPDSSYGTQNLDAYVDTPAATKEGFGSGSPIGCPNDYALCDYYMASSALSMYAGKSVYDYVYSDSIVKVIKAGVRLVDLHVYIVDKKPVVGYGSKNNQMLSYNTIPLEECCVAVANTAFADDTVGGKNPFVLSLNIHTESSTSMTDCAEILKTTLRKFMLSSEYSYGRRDIAIEPVCNLMGKLVIISGTNTKRTAMDELVNMAWGTSSLRRVTHTEAAQSYEPGGDIDYNRRKITMVVPDEDATDLKNRSPELAFTYGCQWVAMNYGSLDSNMDIYVGRFLESPFDLKPEPMRYKVVTEKPVVQQDPALALGPKEMSSPIGSYRIEPVKTHRTLNKV
jgi:hypothetical protein